ncbi:MAG: SLATT domain-containing protein [Microscillaceae bacterium]|nr:SLATT domain-containing protein [Microscillaceae bacterium]
MLPDQNDPFFMLSNNADPVPPSNPVSQNPAPTAQPQEDIHDDHLSHLAGNQDHDVLHEDDHDHDLHQLGGKELQRHDEHDDDEPDPFVKMATQPVDDQGGFFSFLNQTPKEADNSQGGFFTQALSQASSMPTQNNPQNPGNPGGTTNNMGSFPSNLPQSGQMGGFQGNQWGNQGTMMGQNPMGGIQGNQMGNQWGQNPYNPSAGMLTGQQTMNNFTAFNQNKLASQQLMGGFQAQINSLQPNTGRLGRNPFGPPTEAGNFGWKETSYMEELQRAILKRVQEREKKHEKIDEEEKIRAEETLNNLLLDIQREERNYRKWESKAKTWAFIFKFLSSALAAVVTVLLGVNITDGLRAWGVDWYVNFLALVISAFISLIGVFQQFYDSDKLWIKYADTANRLSRILNFVEYLKPRMDYVGVEDVDEIAYEHDRIIESTHNYEIEIRADDDETSDRIRQQSMMMR